MNEFLNSTEERTEGIVTMSLISAKYQVFRVFVIVTLMLDVCGTQGLQAGIFLCQVLHCCLHVQPDKEANKQIQHRNLKKNTLLHNFPAVMFGSTQRDSYSQAVCYLCAKLCC